MREVGKTITERSQRPGPIGVVEPGGFRWRRYLPLLALLLAASAAVAAAMFSAGTSATAAPPVSAVRVIRSFPHDPSSFCQGLVVHHGNILEGTGQYRQSRLRHIELETGKPLKELRLADSVFGEGITVYGSRIYQLTWRNGFLQTWDSETFEPKTQVSYRDIDPSLREGWGITHDGTNLIISDGTATIRFVDPATFRMVRRITVKNGFRTQKQLNELEYVDGEIFANVWYSDQIARIHPDTGAISGWLNLASLRPREVRHDREAVLNGIAWDAETRRLFVTGKNWPVLYEIEILSSADTKR